MYEIIGFVNKSFIHRSYFFLYTNIGITMIIYSKMFKRRWIQQLYNYYRNVFIKNKDIRTKMYNIFIHFSYLIKHIFTLNK